jgi:hypothetical protein
MNSIGRVGSQAEKAGAGARAEPRTNAAAAKRPNECVERCIATSSRSFVPFFAGLVARDFLTIRAAPLWLSNRISLGMHNTKYAHVAALDFGGNQHAPQHD